MPWWQGLCLCPGSTTFRASSSLAKQTCWRAPCVWLFFKYSPQFTEEISQYLTSDRGLPWGLLQSMSSLAHSLLRKLAREWLPEPRCGASALAFAGITARIKDPPRAAKHGLNPLGGVRATSHYKVGDHRREISKPSPSERVAVGESSSGGTPSEGQHPLWGLALGCEFYGFACGLSRQVPLQDWASETQQQQGFLSVEAGWAFLGHWICSI